MSSEVLTAIRIQVEAFWIVTPCGVVAVKMEAARTEFKATRLKTQEATN
jgi:hypothetical protein